MRSCVQPHVWIFLFCLCFQQEQYHFLYSALEGVFPLQNGEVKAAEAPATDTVQIVNETKAVEPPAEQKPAQAAAAPGEEPQAGSESTPLVAAGASEDKKEEPEKDTETTPLDEASNGPTVTV